MNTDLPILSEVESLKEQKRYPEALVLVEKAIGSYPNRYELYEELADVFIFLWEYDRATKALDYAESLENGSATWLYLRGYLCLVCNDFQSAIIHLEESNKKNPNNSEVLRNLWWAYTMIWEYIKWVILLERALIISPDDLLIIEDLWVALLTQWKYQEAREYLKKAGKESHMKDMWFSA